MTISPPMWQIVQALAHQAATQVVTRPGHWTPGKLASVWAKYQHEVEAIVRAEKLQAVQMISEREPLAPTKELGFVWWNPAGGWPLAHFHLADKIYAATPEQWNTFSGQVLAKVGASLQSAKVKVSFDQLTQITEAMPQG